MSAKTLIIKGLLVNTTNNEGDDLLGVVLMDEKNKANCVVLADHLRYTVCDKFTTVRYFTSSKYIESSDDATEKLMLEHFGAAQVEYHMAYSELTGHLWTTEEIKVGGHDLLNELRSSIGYFVYMEIVLGNKNET